MTVKFEKLSEEVTTFSAEFRISSEKNTEAMNKVITGFPTSLQVEKDALSLVRSGIKVEKAKLTSSVLSKIEKLQEDLATKNKIMDELTEKTQKNKVLSEKLKNATQSKTNLEEEHSLVKGCISEINNYLMRLVKTCHSLFTVSVRQQLSEKLQTVFARLKGLFRNKWETRINGQRLKLNRRIM